MSADRTAGAWLDDPEPWRETRRLGRALTAIEGGGETQALAKMAYRRAGRAMTIGLTGPPGVGKSTLTAALTRELRKRGEPVAVLAFDPTSPLTGGAVLGDRVRMSDLETDPGVFIRSMASRGAGGGLAQAAAAATDLLDAAGFPWILVETVGTGQAQTAIRRNSDLVVLVTAPGLGDGVQAIKSGTMEIADVFVVNKSDLPGAAAARRSIVEMLHLADGTGSEPPAVLPTVARTGDGAAEVLDTVSACFERLRAGGEIGARRSARLRRRVLDLYRAEVLQLAMGSVDDERFARDLLAAGGSKALDGEDDSQQNRAPRKSGPASDPYDLADRLVGEFVGGLRQHRGA
ncbi:MAG: methylmalonyl Co-A mutase-associated GTPase MeaB [Acidobacteria bacterium]|nr:methylmalonyl Co-A mutase-associated GTPase MeaB [Acidobacteriota bacterium]MXZ39550.1 methylmalonyl Co-A mutase-associated GTPase MeaB [Holophagales bacterium]MYF05820.1 methylmalonyl Co-A mutase-associated GTPase MeaB [Holophagales bacterium]MYJ26956.1 methylmalonyl Co-A mutase-associated GTPase MeaB [Holophagales bacterium]